MRPPSSLSLFADITLTFSNLFSSTLTDRLDSCDTIHDACVSIPLFMSLKECFSPSCRMYSSMIACAITVEVVLPSPALDAVSFAAAFISVTPRFSTGSATSIDSATVTPSLVTCALPKSSSNTTVRPDAPRVLPTASAIVFIPLINFLLPKVTSFTSLLPPNCIKLNFSYLFILRLVCLCIFFLTLRRLQLLSQQ